MKQNSDLAHHIIFDAIKKHNGLSDFDSEPLDAEVRAILRALKKKGLRIVPCGPEYSRILSST